MLASFALHMRKPKTKTGKYIGLCFSHTLNMFFCSYNLYTDLVGERYWHFIIWRRQAMLPFHTLMF